MIYKNQIARFPAQKRATRDKDEKWFKECADAAENIYLYGNEETTKRDSLKVREENQNLYDGIISQDNIEKTMNPWNLKADTFPSTMRHYPIARSKVDLLVGEEFRRKLQFTIMVSNESAVSQKEEMIHRKIVEFLEKNANPIQTPDFDKVSFEKELKKLEQWRKYEAQDIRERRATQILQHDSIEQKFDIKFNQGFKDALVMKEEIYCIDIYGNKPILRRCDPRNIVVFGIGDSSNIEDADGIIEVGYIPNGRIIDMYYDELTPDQIDKLEGSKDYVSGVRNMLKYDENLVYFPSWHFDTSGGTLSRYFDSETDQFGNMRVMIVTWKSRRKLGVLSGYDKEGNPYETIVDENYKVNKMIGETIEWLWVNEWLRVVKIGRDMYIKMGPLPVQYRRMDNLSICGSGYVGTIYPKSLMGLMKPYNYMYDILAYRLDKAIAKYKGPMLEVDLAKIPDGWELDKWFYYGEEMSYLLVDSFKEGKKGHATGMLAGTVGNTTGRVFNPELGHYIAQNIELMKYIHNQLGEVVGITPQREGAIDNRETVGGIERSVTQSSNTTEEWFVLHDDTKLRVYEAYIGMAKYCYRNYKNKKVQYISDELSQSIFEIDGDEFAEADYGIVATNSSLAQEIRGTLKGLIQAGIQNQLLDFTQVMDIYMNPSMSEMRRKIEFAETQRREREDLARQQDMQNQQKLSQDQLAMKEKEMELKKYEIDQKNQTAIEVAEINADKQIETAELKNDMEHNKLQHIMRSDNNNMELQRKQIDEEKRKNIETERIKREDNKNKNKTKETSRDKK